MSYNPRLSELFLIRHGATGWSMSGRHTGSTDLALNEEGQAAARELGLRLAEMSFDAAYTSPLIRARETAVLAGLGHAQVLEDLVEWDYGDYEGLTTAEILALRPGWDLFRDGCPGGEDPNAIARRVDRVLAQVTPPVEAGATVALVAHGHILRVLAARWLGGETKLGGSFVLSTASVSVLSTERDHPVIAVRWNT